MTQYRHWEQPPGYLEQPPFVPPVSATPEWLTPRTRAIMETPTFQAEEAWRQQMATGGYTPAGMPPRPTAEAATALEGLGGMGLREPMTYEEAQEMQRRLGAGYYIDYDEDIGGYRVERDPRFFEPPPRVAPISPWQEEQIRLTEEEARRAQEQQEWQRQWTQQQAEQEQAWRREQMGWQEEQARMQQEQWQQQFGWQQQQFAAQQEQAERQHGARLMAQPASWLEYAGYTGEQPAIQPWMAPLMPQQYGWQVGGQIPGWTAESGAEMPQLTSPSAQLWARMGPTAQQQYGGYRQARSGIRPEETEFRRRATAPPGGMFGGLRWSR